MGFAYHMQFSPGTTVPWIGSVACLDVRRRYIASIVTRAGVDLSPTAAWLLVQIEREHNVDVNELGRRAKCDAKNLHAPHLAELWPEWSPTKREEVADILRRLARELVRKPELLDDWANHCLTPPIPTHRISTNSKTQLAQAAVS